MSDILRVLTWLTPVGRRIAQDVAVGLRMPPRHPRLRRALWVAAFVFAAWFLWSDLAGWGDVQ